MNVTVLGLGEAGSLFAGGLAAAGVTVVGFDPLPVTTPPGVRRAPTAGDAVDRADLVIALTPALEAPGALDQVAGAVPPGAVYADLSTGTPGLKQSLAQGAAHHELLFVDVALMGVVPGNGLRTPSLACGPGARQYQRMLTPLGASIDVVEGQPGEAARRKLLRSVFMKGLAAVAIEACRGAEAVGLQDWLWRNIVDEITRADEALLSRLIEGTATHALRRTHEMEASEAMLVEMGVEPIMTRATVASLKDVPRIGVPDPQVGARSGGQRSV